MWKVFGMLHRVAMVGRKYTKLVVALAASILAVYHFISPSQEFSRKEPAIIDSERCDWEDKPALQKCLSEAARDYSQDEMDGLIISLGFVLNQAESSTAVRYYSRVDNGIGNYKVTITLRTKADGTSVDVSVR